MTRSEDPTTDRSSPPPVRSGTARPLLVLGAGSRPYQEDALRTLAARHQVVLADSEPGSWTRPYVSRQLTVDLTDPAATEAAVKEFAGRTLLAGVCTVMQHHAELTARLAEQLGLPGSSPAAIAACRDKAHARRLLAEHGVPSARCVQVADESAAIDQARLIGYPVIVKPLGLGGTAGVWRADSDAEAGKAYWYATGETGLGLRPYGVPGVLVEEYLDGEDISAETVVLNSDVTIVAITRTQRGPEGTLQATGHSVDASDPLLDDDAVTGVVTAAVRALGIERGVLHIELRLTEHGPALMEVSARPGGDLIELLVQHATGIDLVAAAADLATGTVPDLTPRHRRAAGVRFLYPASAGRVCPPYVAAEFREHPWLERLVWTRHFGERVSAPPHASVEDRLGHWVVTGETLDDCRRRLGEVGVQVSAHTTH